MRETLLLRIMLSSKSIHWVRVNNIGSAVMTIVDTCHSFISVSKGDGKSGNQDGMRCTDPKSIAMNGVAYPTVDSEFSVA